MSFEQLQSYTPEAPKEGGFEPFKYTGKAKIEKSIISINKMVDTEFYPIGCNQIEIEAIVLEGENAGRKLWKRFNLDDEHQDKKGKTSLHKLADQLWAVGLTFKSLEELKAVNESFVDMEVNIKAWPVDFKDGRDKVQMWNIKGRGNSWSTSNKPSF